MNKQEFIAELQSRLSGFSKQDVAERIDFYIEMIDDRMEDGLSEEDAVAQIGSVDAIAQQIMSEASFAKNEKQATKSPKRFKVWEIVLLALGSPIWISLAVAAFVVILAVYIVLWAGIASLWAVFGALVACGVAGVVGGILFAFLGIAPMGFAIVGAGCFCAGLSIFMFFGCLLATKGAFVASKKTLFWLFGCFAKKEEA